MDDRPILFSAPMVRALLNGTKTQTRRVVKRFEVRAGMPEPEMQSLLRCCPYGAPGDRLWVRETWRERVPDQDGQTNDYRADHESGEDPCDVRWVPSIHMPRRASRITLELTGVRIERLQEISEADAKAEGCIAPMYASEDADPSFAVAYRHLWEAINGADTWDTNPYVWCLDFRRV